MLYLFVHKLIICTYWHGGEIEIVNTIDKGQSNVTKATLPQLIIT